MYPALEALKHKSRFVPHVKVNLTKSMPWQNHPRIYSTRRRQRPNRIREDWSRINQCLDQNPGTPPQLRKSGLMCVALNGYLQ